MFKKIKEPVGEGKIIQEKKKDAFDVDIYLRKLKKTKLMQANLSMKDTFIERINSTSIVMSSIKGVWILEKTWQMDTYNQFSFSSRLKRLYEEFNNPEKKLKDEHDSFHKYCLENFKIHLSKYKIDGVLKLYTYLYEYELFAYVVGELDQLIKYSKEIGTYLSNNEAEASYWKSLKRVETNVKLGIMKIENTDGIDAINLDTMNQE